MMSIYDFKILYFWKIKNAKISQNPKINNTFLYLKKFILFVVLLVLYAELRNTDISAEKTKPKVGKTARI